MRPRPVAEVNNRLMCPVTERGRGLAVDAGAIALTMDRTMTRLLEETLRPSPAELREEAWSLLYRRRQITDGPARREFASRAFELAQLASRLEFEAAKAHSKAVRSTGLFE